MTVLPIVERELRVAARRPGAAWLRALAAFAAVAVGMGVILSAPAWMPSYEIGKLLFVWQAVLAFVFCLFAGAFLTADCLSFEKREGTLGLLFLTDLRGYDLVLGKLTSSSVVSTYALGGTFPVLALPLLMGGVTGAEFGRVVLVLLATLLLSLAVGMAVSALGRETRQTLLGTLGLLVLLAGLGPVIMWFGAVVTPGRRVNEAWLFGSPVGALIRAFEANYRWGLGAGAFWLSLAGLFAMALGSLIFASVWTQRRWQERAASAPTGSWRARWEQWRWGSSAWRRRARGGLDSAPLVWLVRRDRLACLQAWAAVGSLGGLWLCLLVGLGNGPRYRDLALFYSMIVSFVLHVAFKVVVATEASRRLSEDKRSGALELLLVTPLPLEAILREHRQALWKHFRAPALALVAVNLVMFWLLPVANPVGLPTAGRLFFGEAFLLGAVVLASDFQALNWVGMLQGLRSRTHVRAVLATLARILLPPWLGVLLFMFVVALGRSLRETDLPAYAFVWFLLGFFLSLAHVTWARLELSSQFRRLAGGEVGARLGERGPTSVSGHAPDAPA